MRSNVGQRLRAATVLLAVTSLVLSAPSSARSQTSVGSPQPGQDPSAQAGQASQSGQAGGSFQPQQSGDLNVGGKGPSDPQALPGRGEPEKPGQTGGLKEQAIQQGTGGSTSTSGAAGSSTGAPVSSPGASSGAAPEISPK
jgi:hypothetical protein